MASVKNSHGTPINAVLADRKPSLSEITKKMTCRAIPSATNPMAAAINAVYIFACAYAQMMTCPAITTPMAAAM